jgi:hypothetical protein
LDTDKHLNWNVVAVQLHAIRDVRPHGFRFTALYGICMCTSHFHIIKLMSFIVSTFMITKFDVQLKE